MKNKIKIEFGAIVAILLVIFTVFYKDITKFVNNIIPKKESSDISLQSQFVGDVFDMNFEQVDDIFLKGDEIIKSVSNTIDFINEKIESKDFSEATKDEVLEKYNSIEIINEEEYNFIKCMNYSYNLNNLIYSLEDYVDLYIKSNNIEGYDFQVSDNILDKIDDHIDDEYSESINLLEVNGFNYNIMEDGTIVYQSR